MPRVKQEPVVTGLKVQGRGAGSDSSAFEIRDEIVRWDSVKTAHDLCDDMEVARLLLDCYDLIGGHFLVWSDTAKLAPPPLYATLRLQHVSDEGWHILQEIKDLGAWQNPIYGRKKSRRKQAEVRHIWQIMAEEDDFETYGFSEEECHDSQDDDYDPTQDDENYKPKKSVKTSRRKRRFVDQVEEQKVETKDDDGSVEKQNDDTDKQNSDDSDDDTEEVSDEDSESQLETKQYSQKTTKKKPGRPNKEEVQPKAEKVVKKKKRTNQVKKNWGRFAKVSKVYECTLCASRTESPYEFKEHYKTHFDTVKTQAKNTTSNSDTDKARDEDDTKNTNDAVTPADALVSDITRNKDTVKTPEDTQVGETTTSNKAEPGRFNLEKHAIILFRCLACNEILKCKDEHRKTHDRNKRPMVCHLCGKILGSVETWRKHLQMHEAKFTGVQILCKICGKSFPILASLKSHMRSHSKARPHICDSCGKGFKTQYHLDRHLLIHREVKPLVCTYCGKGFNNESNLKGHIRIHTGQKPYKCDLCPMAFTHNVSLKSHKKSVHGIDMWKVPSRVGSSLECDDLFQNTADTETIPKLEKGQSSTASKPSSSDLGDLEIQQGLNTIATDIQAHPSEGEHHISIETNKNVHPDSHHGSGDTPNIPSVISGPPSFGLVRSSEQPIAQIPPFSSILPLPQIAEAEFMNIPLIRRGPPFNVPDAATMSSQSAQDYWEAARRTFTKL